MKTIEEFRAHKLHLLQQMLQRPGMFMAHEEVLWFWLNDMLFVDNRPDAWEIERDRLRAQGRYRSTGVQGGFQNLEARTRKREPTEPAYPFFRHTDEVMSVFAEVFWRLGYLTLNRQLTAEEWQSLNASLNSFRTGDFRQADVVRIAGDPSLIVASKIICYAGPDCKKPWCFFDFERLPYQHPDRNNPFLRHVRFQGRSEPEMIVTEYGKRIDAHD